MNSFEIRQRLKTLLSRPVPESDLDFKARVFHAIDCAQKRIANEVPLALIPDHDFVTLAPEYETGIGGITATATRTTDAYVIDLGTTPGFETLFPIKFDGTWDGIYWIEVTLVSGEKILRQCREFFLEPLGPPPAASKQYVSLTRPILTSFTGAHARLFQPYVYLSQDMMEVLEGTLVDTASETITTLPEGFARDVGILDNGTNTPKGQPIALCRAQHYQLDAPNIAPAVKTIEGTFGPEGRGTFAYLITYGWGKREAILVNEAGTLRPQFESGPSPVSSKVTVLVNQAIELALPNIDWEINFDVSGTLRKTHSGLVKRIYRARYTVTTGTVTALETPEVFQFLAEVDGSVTSFVDDGSEIPEYSTRLPEVTGFYAYRPYPQHDKHYTLDLRSYRRPRELTNDYDQARVSPECIDVLLFFALHYLCFYDNDPQKAALFEKKAVEQIGYFRARHASPAKVVPGTVWGRGGENYSDSPFLTWTRFVGS